jgi:hypothetical protein
VDVGPIGRTTVNLASFSHFTPNHVKSRTCGFDPRNKLGVAILTSYIGAVCGNRIFRNYGMNGGYFRASKLRQARQASELELPSIQSSNHLNHWIDCRSIYKTLKDRHHWRLHALSRATGVLGLAAHAPPRAAEPPRSPKSFFQASTRIKTTTNG